MVEIEVTLTTEEWKQIKKDYRENWRDEIKAGDCPKEISVGDAWAGMLAHGEPDEFEISWDLCTDEDFV
jgi:hypothetical protein